MPMPREHRERQHPPLTAIAAPNPAGPPASNIGADINVAACSILGDPAPANGIPMRMNENYPSAEIQPDGRTRCRNSSTPHAARLPRYRRSVRAKVVHRVLNREPLSSGSQSRRSQLRSLNALIAPRQASLKSPASPSGVSAASMIVHGIFAFRIAPSLPGNTASTPGTTMITCSGRHHHFVPAAIRTALCVLSPSSQHAGPCNA